MNINVEGIILLDEPLNDSWQTLVQFRILEQCRPV